MEELKSSGKPFDISKTEVWDAWIKVKENQGASGVHGQSLEAFEKNLKNNLYRIWLCRVRDYAEWVVGLNRCWSDGLMPPGDSA